MNLPLPVLDDCWNRIGVHGDQSCAELPRVVHCHNCAVFAAAGRRFLDAPSPPGYIEEWARRLADPIEESARDLLGVLTFRLAGEWLALSVHSLVEVTDPRPVHRIPHRGGVLAGLVNIRGELYLCAHLDQVLGISRRDEWAVPGPVSDRARTMTAEADGGNASYCLVPKARLLVLRRDTERWVFRADEVDQVHRFPLAGLTPPPATVLRSLAHLTRGVFHWQGRTIGLVDDERLFQALRTRMR
jgi:chemotaxis-related protein WspD